MRRFFGELEFDKFVVEGEELKHLSSVIRLGVGDKFIGVVGDEFDYVCQIESVDKKRAVALVLEKSLNKSNPKKNLVLFQALIKKDNFELILQKAVELGMSKVFPFVSENCVNKSGVNLERLNSLISSACKQCERSVPMALSQAVKFDEMLKTLKDFDIVVFANEIDGQDFDFTSLSKFNSIAFIVGCEGGFTEKEKESLVTLQNVRSVNLGSRILRAETASIVVMGLGSLLSRN